MNDHSSDDPSYSTLSPTPSTDILLRDLLTFPDLYNEIQWSIIPVALVDNTNSHLQGTRGFERVGQFSLQPLEIIRRFVSALG
jgi:hypothetical protein